MFDVTQYVRADRLAGRIRSQYPVRGFLRPDEGNRVDFITIGGAEHQNGAEPILAIVFQP